LWVRFLSPAWFFSFGSLKIEKQKMALKAITALVWALFKDESNFQASHYCPSISPYPI
jgi:hypothetical protein